MFTGLVVIGMLHNYTVYIRACCGYRMMVGFTTTHVHMQSVPISPLILWVWIPLRRDVLDTTLCDKVCQRLATGQWFSPGTPFSPTNKTDHHDITEIFLKVTLSTIQGSHASWKTGNTREFGLHVPGQEISLKIKKNGQNPGFTLEIFIDSVIF